MIVILAPFGIGGVVDWSHEADPAEGVRNVSWIDESRGAGFCVSNLEAAAFWSFWGLVTYAKSHVDVDVSRASGSSRTP